MQHSHSGFRTLRPEELEAVAGSGSTNTYMNGTTQVTEHFDDEGWFTGATYSRVDGSGSWFNISGESGSWGATNWGSLSGSAAYGSAGFGYMGAVGGFSQVYGGDTYAYVGVGTPGPAGGIGADADGDLEGLSLALQSPTGVTTIVVDPTTGYVTAAELGRTGSYLTYSVNLSDVLRHFTGMAHDFARGFIDTYYPNPDGYSEQQVLEQP